MKDKKFATVDELMSIYNHSFEEIMYMIVETYDVKFTGTYGN